MRDSKLFWCFSYCHALVQYVLPSCGFYSQMYGEYEVIWILLWKKLMYGNYVEILKFSSKKKKKKNIKNLNLMYLKRSKINNYYPWHGWSGEWAAKHQQHELYYWRRQEKSGDILEFIGVIMVCCWTPKFSSNFIACSISAESTVLLCASGTSFFYYECIHSKLRNRLQVWWYYAN